jgi:hypothetical protein
MMQSADTETAIACAARGARRYFMFARAFRRAVKGVSRLLEKYSRAAYVIRRRELVVRMEPGPASPPEPLEALPDASGLDPWSLDLDANELERRSRVYSQCPSCDGIGAPECCSACRGSGIVTVWLTIQEQKFVQVVVSSEYLALRIHPNVHAIEDFDRSLDDSPAHLESDSGWMTAPSDVPTALYPSVVLETDRVEAVRVQVFIAEIFSVAYRIRQGKATVEVTGRVPRVLPWSNWAPLKLRLIGVLSFVPVVLLLSACALLMVPKLGVLSFLPSLPRFFFAVLLAGSLALLLQSRRIWSFARRHLPPGLGGHLRSPRRMRSGVTITRTAPTMTS